MSVELLIRSIIKVCGRERRREGDRVLNMLGKSHSTHTHILTHTHVVQQMGILVVLAQNVCGAMRCTSLTMRSACKSTTSSKTNRSSSSSNRNSSSSGSNNSSSHALWKIQLQSRPTAVEECKFSFFANPFCDWGKCKCRNNTQTDRQTDRQRDVQQQPVWVLLCGSRFSQRCSVVAAN